MNGLQARRRDPTGQGIHNKLVLAQIGGRGWVVAGSLNGGEVSAKLNRETALLVGILLQQHLEVIFARVGLLAEGLQRFVVLDQVDLAGHGALLHAPELLEGDSYGHALQVLARSRDT